MHVDDVWMVFGGSLASTKWDWGCGTLQNMILSLIILDLRKTTAKTRGKPLQVQPSGKEKALFPGFRELWRPHLQMFWQRIWNDVPGNSRFETGRNPELAKTSQNSLAASNFWIFGELISWCAEDRTTAISASASVGDNGSCRCSPNVIDGLDGFGRPTHTKTLFFFCWGQVFSETEGSQDHLFSFIYQFSIDNYTIFLLP